MEVFAALADPTRWRVLTLLAERGEATATTLAGDLPVSRVAVIKHLIVLDRAGLVQSRKQGREVRYTVRPERLTAAARQLNAIAGEWDARLAAIKRLAEAGVPAVIAMQGNVTMRTIADFMPVFFKELQRDGQIDRAVVAARGTVRERPDFWMPVLFMRLKSGRIWYVPGFGDDRKGFEKWPALIRSQHSGGTCPASRAAGARGPAGVGSGSVHLTASA